MDQNSTKLLFLLAGLFIVSCSNFTLHTTQGTDDETVDPTFQLFKNAAIIEQADAQAAMVNLINNVDIRQLNQTDPSSGKTLLYLMSEKADFEGVARVIDAALNKGADVDLENKDGRLFLVSMAYYGQYSNLQKLVKKCFSRSNCINKADHNGSTPYHVLESYRKYEGVDELLYYIKYELSLSVDTVSLINLTNGKMKFAIEFNDTVFVNDKTRSKIELIDMNEIKYPLKLLNSTGKAVYGEIPDFCHSNRYCLTIDKDLHSSPGKTLVSDLRLLLRFEGLYNKVDEHALSAPATVENCPKLLASYLTEHFDDEMLKVRAIYRWITDRIAYDVSQMNLTTDKMPSISEVFHIRKSVCEGYARLFKVLCDSVDIPCEIVKGWVKSENEDLEEKPNHSWNCFKARGKSYLCDATWGAGYLKEGEFIKRFNDYHFCPPPQEYISSHYPEDKPKQFLATPVDKKTFLQSIPKDEAYRFGIKVLEPNGRIIHHNRNASIKLKIFDDIDLHVKCDGKFGITKKGFDWTVNFKKLPKKKGLIRIYARHQNNVGNKYWQVLEFETQF